MQRVLFSIFNPTGAQPGQLYSLLEQRFKDEGDHSYVFAGSPFSSIPHPLDVGRHGMDRQELLEGFWADILLFVEGTIVPELTLGKNVVVEAFDLDAFLSAATGACGDEFRKLAAYHHGMLAEHLRKRMKVRGDIVPPIYLLPNMEHPYETALMQRTLGTDYYGQSTISRCITQRNDARRAYFSEPNGQLPPHRVDCRVDEDAYVQQAYGILLGTRAGLVAA